MLDMVPGADPLPLGSPDEVVAAVAAGRAHFGVVALENSLDGAVTATFDALLAHPGTQIIAETDVRIEFALLRRGGGPIRRFATHPVAFQQVRGFVDSELADAQFVPAASNAAAAQMVADGEVDAAFAPRRAADIYDLEVVADSVIDDASATTRFVLVSAGEGPAPSGADRTAVSLCLVNEPGSLARALDICAGHGLDLSLIESRPTRTGLGTYRFHLHFGGHAQLPEVAPALEKLRGLCAPAGDVPGFMFLGSWPVADGPVSG